MVLPKTSPPVRLRLPGDEERAHHALVRAWIAAGLMLAVVATAAIVMNRIDLEAGFLASWLVLAAVVLVVVAFAVVAARSGRQAQRFGRVGGVVPAAIGSTVAGIGVFLAVVTLVAHALGFE
jgi:hypothetical protein